MRRTSLRPSRGTVWPPDVREHVKSHQPPCIGELTDPPMPGICWPPSELDHFRASGGIGVESLSIATNAARLCHAHHEVKTHDARTWRPRLLTVIARLHSECASCQREAIETWGQPLEVTA